MRKINKKYLIIAGFLLAMAIVAILIISRESKPKTVVTDIVPTIVPTTSFLVESTVPADKATEVFPGELQISFTSDVIINSANDYSFYLSPPPDIAPKLISNFPNKTVTHQILGGLDKETEYTVIVSNKHSQNVAIWSFVTSKEQPQSSSALVAQEEEELAKNYYPLFSATPYENNNFSIYYTDRFTLLVEIKRNNVEGIKKEATSWIQSKGVNPSSHTITFENKF